MSAVSSYRNNPSIKQPAFKRRKVGSASNPESHHGASVRRISPDFLNRFYKGMFLPIHPDQYVQVVKFDNTAVTILEKMVGKNDPVRQYAQMRLDSPINDYYSSGDDQVLAFVPEKGAHFFGTVVSIEENDINLNLEAADGRSFPYTIERVNNTALTNFERIMVVRGPNLLKNIPFEVTDFEFAGENYLANGYNLGV